LTSDKSCFNFLDLSTKIFEPSKTILKVPLSTGISAHSAEVIPNSTSIPLLYQALIDVTLP